MNLETKKAMSANVALKNHNNSKLALIKNIQHKHTVKLRTKQPDLLSYIIKLSVGSVPIICYALITKVFTILHEVNINIELPKYLYLLSLTFLFFNSLYIWFVSPISLSKVQRLKNTIRKTIEVNDFFYENKELNKITLSMLIKFYWLEDTLYLEVYPNGGKYTYKMNELTEIFQTTLNMTVIAVQDDFANHTTYILSKETDNYIDSTNEWTV